MRLTSIFSKLFLTFTAVIVVSFLLFGVVYLYLFHVQLYADYEASFAEKRDTLTAQFELAENFGWTQGETEAVIGSLLESDSYTVHLYGDGDVRFSNGETDAAVHLLDGVDSAISAEGNWDGAGLDYVMAGPVNHESVNQMTMTFTGLEEDYLQAVFMIVTSFITVLTVAAAVLWFMTKRMTDPLRAMNDVARQMSTGDFSKQVDIRTRDEIGELGETLNRMASELATIESTRKTILANISHDLRSPLTSVKGFLIALEDGTIPVEKRFSYYERIRSETDRVITLVNDILELTRIESGGITLDRETYDLTDQLNEQIRSFEKPMADKGIQLHFEPAARDGLSVYADYNRLNRVWQNLLENALRYTPEGQSVTVSAVHSVHLVTVHVTNSGTVIPEETLPLIWERFYKADDSRSGKGGSGIGLSIVKSITGLHGGTVDVDSNEESGTTFSVTLPSAFET
ncbi:sensor histidine kinase [Salisediminibacterium selenitireducens]|uniref:histidine kinase n=1 Tax=Bacillus selenitireducens (strain ATCC 700615 / DSM 15326 / MLS10) TaxID=439292 RepID=D6XYM9_BACIE|nr:HAMP domain-containing sensor histidine kinase [Salisediminibacterium selenitireducens]ADH98187.1 integral membrane sensor signal transduction histidine kinase [[Bacillus] selenitireducens MLS10]